MSTKGSSTLLVAGSAALLVAGIGILSKYQANSSSVSSGGASPASTSLQEVDEEECITENDVAKIFDRLFMEMQAVLSQLMQQIQQIQMTGQMIPEKQLKAIIRSEMERALLLKQKAVLEQFDVDYECLEEATWEFLEKEDEYPKVKKAVDRFQKLWENSTGDEVVGWRPGKMSTRAVQDTLSAERTIEMADKYFTALTDSMRTLVTRYKAEGRNLQDEMVQQALNMEFAQGASDAGESALASEGVTLSQFESSVKMHSSNPVVGRSLAMLQMKQQQDLMAIGVA
jgi:hypothetical protein